MLLQLNHDKGLFHGVGNERADIFGDAGVQHGSLHRGLVASEKGIEQDVGCHDARALACVANDEARAGHGILGCGAHGLRQAEVANGCLRFDGARQKRVGACFAALFLVAKLFFVHGCEVPLVKPCKGTFDVKVAVKHGVAVGKLVVATMLVKVVFIGERGDALGRAARFECVGGVGEKRLLQLVVKDRG